MKSCPPGKSKTRLVTRLKTEKYKAPNCGYKWELDEPEAAEETEGVPTPAQQPYIYESTPVYDSYLPEGTEQIVPAEPATTPEVSIPEPITPPKPVLSLIHI